MNVNRNSQQSFHSLKTGKDIGEALKTTSPQKLESTTSTRIVESQIPSIPSTVWSTDIDSNQDSVTSEFLPRFRYSQTSKNIVPDTKYPILPECFSDRISHETTALKRTQSDGDLPNGEFDGSWERSQITPVLQKKVHFSPIYDDADQSYANEFDKNSDEWKKRSRSFENLNWKFPQIDVKRRVNLSSQKQPTRRSRSAESPRKSILKTKRITETSRIKVSGSIPASSETEQKTKSKDKSSKSANKDVTSKEYVEQLTSYSQNLTNSTITAEEQPKPFEQPKRFRVQKDVKLEPEIKPKPLIFTRKWKSEPSLAFGKSRPQRSKSMDCLLLEKETKLSNVKIDLIKPINIKPLKPANSVSDLPFATMIRTEEKLHLEPQRWKSNPELSSHKLFEGIGETSYQRKTPKEFETKILRALPVHLQPLHQPSHPKTTSLKATEVKDASMQVMRDQSTRSEGTQVYFHPSANQGCKSTQTEETLKIDKASEARRLPDKLTIPAQLLFDFQKSEIKKKHSKSQKPVKIQINKIIAKDQVDNLKKKVDPSEKGMVEKLEVDYSSDFEKHEESSVETFTTSEKHEIEVKLTQSKKENEEEEKDIQIGRIDDISTDTTIRLEMSESNGFKPKFKPEPCVGSIEEIQVMEKQDKMEQFPNQPEIGSLFVRNITEEDLEKENKERKMNENRHQQHDKKSKELGTETVLVGRYNITKSKHSPVPEYYKEQDIGRIVIEEIPKDLSKRNVTTEEIVSPKIIKMKATHEVLQKHLDTKNVIKIQRNDKLGPKMEVKKFISDSVDGGSNTEHEEFVENLIEPRYIEDIYEQQKKFKARREMAAEKVTVVRSDRSREIIPSKKSKEHSVGKIIIHEIPEKSSDKHFKSRETVTKKGQRFDQMEKHMEAMKHSKRSHELVDVPLQSRRVDEILLTKSDIKELAEKRSEQQGIDFLDSTKKTQPGKQKAYQEITTEKRSERKREPQSTYERKRLDSKGKQEIGRILIEEIPEEKEAMCDILSKPNKDLTVIKHDAISKQNVKDNVPDKQNIYAKEFCKFETKSKRVNERVATYKEKVKEARKWIKKENDMELGTLNVTGFLNTPVEYETQGKEETHYVKGADGPCESKCLPYVDKCQRITEQHFHESEETTEKVKINKITESHKTTAKFAQPRYHRVHELVMKDNPQDEHTSPKMNISRKPIISKINFTEENTADVSKSNTKEGILKIGKLDIQELEKSTKRFTEEEKILTGTDNTKHKKVTSKRKVNNSYDDHELGRPNIHGVQCNKANPPNKMYFTELKKKEIDVIRNYVPHKVAEYSSIQNVGRVLTEEISHKQGKELYCIPKSRNINVIKYCSETKNTKKSQSKRSAMKVGKLDVSDLEKTSVESREINDTVQSKNKDVVKKHKLQPSFFEDDPDDDHDDEKKEYEMRKEFMKNKSQNTMTKKCRHDIEKKEKLERVKEQDIGDIVIEKLPKHETTLKQKPKYIKEPINTNVVKKVVGKENGSNVKKILQEEELVKVGRLYIRAFQETQKKAADVSDTLVSHKEKNKRLSMVKNGRIAEKNEIGSLNIQNVGYNVHERDELDKQEKKAFKKVVCDKIKATEDEVSCLEYTKRPNGLIVEFGKNREKIVETNVVSEPEIHFKDKQKPEIGRVSVEQYNDEIPRKSITKDIIKVGKLDVINLDETKVSRTYRERGTSHGGKIDAEHGKQKQKMPENKNTDTAPERTGKVSVIRIDNFQGKKEKEYSNKRNHEVGQIVIEAVPQQKEALLNQFPKFIGAPKRTNVIAGKNGLLNIQKILQKEMVKVGKLDTLEFEQAKKDSGRLKYPNDLRVGMGTEKVMRRKDELPQRLKNNKAVEIRREMWNAPSTHVKEDVGKIDKLEFINVDQAIIESKTQREIATIYKDKADNKYKEKVTEVNPGDGNRYKKEPWKKSIFYDVKNLKNEPTVEQVPVAKEGKTQLTKVEGLEYPGRVVYEEIPKQKNKELLHNSNYIGEPKSTNVVAEKTSILNVPNIFEKVDLVNVGKLDVREFERTQNISSTSIYPKELNIGRMVIEEMPEKKKDKVARKNISTKDKQKFKIKEMTMEEIHHAPKVQSEIIKKDYLLDRFYEQNVDLNQIEENEQLKDDSKCEYRQVTPDKVTTTEDKVSKLQQTNEPIYPKELDIGRMVIEEMPEKGNGIPKGYISHRDKPRSRCGKVRGARRENANKDDVEVDKFDLTEHNQTRRESKIQRVNDTMYTNTVNATHKATNEETNVDGLYVQGYEKLAEGKEMEERTNILQQKNSAQKLMIVKGDAIASSGDVSKLINSNELNIGRLVIEEMPNKRDGVPKQDFHCEMLTKHTSPDAARQEIIESNNLHEKRTIYTEKVDDATQTTKWDIFKWKQQNPVLFKDDNYYNESIKKLESRLDESSSLQRISGEQKIVVAEVDESPIGMKTPKYLVGDQGDKIVVDEIPPKLDEKMQKYYQYIGEHKIDDLANRKDILDVSGTAKKTGMIQVGGLGVKKVDSLSRESKSVNQKHSLNKDDIYHPQKAQNHERLKADSRVDSLHVYNVIYDNNYQKKTEVKRNVPGEKVTMQNIMISKDDIIDVKDNNQTKYPKEMNVGHIGIKEAPEEKQDNKETASSTRAQLTAEIIERKNLQIQPLPPQPFTMYTDKVDSTLKSRRDDRIKECQKTLIVDDDYYYKEKDHNMESHLDYISPMQKQVTTEDAPVINTDESLPETLKEPICPTFQNVGRIIIEEIPNGQEKISVYNKYFEKSKSSDGVSRKVSISDHQEMAPEKDMGNIDRLDVKDTTKQPRTFQGFVTKTDGKYHARKAKDREESTAEKNIDHSRVYDIKYNNCFEKKLVQDETNIPHQKITTKKSMVSGDNITFSEETTKNEHPNGLNIARIVIEKVPTKRDHVSNQATLTEITESRHGKIDAESLHEEGTIYHGVFKPMQDAKFEKRQKPFIINDDNYKEKFQKSKSELEDTISMQKQVTTGNIKVTGIHEPRVEKLEKPSYPKVHEIGRSVIDEIPEEQQKIPLHENYSKISTSTDMASRKECISDFSKIAQKSMTQVVQRLEKTPKESKIVHLKRLAEADEIRHPPKVKERDSSLRGGVDYIHVHESDTFSDKKPLEDEMYTPRQCVTVHKTAVYKDNITRSEGTTQSRRPKEMNVGRYEIEDVLGGKGLISKRNPSHQKRENPSSTEIAPARHEIIDLKDLPTEISTIYTDKADEVLKTNRDDKYKEQQKALIIKDDNYHKEKDQHLKSKLDNTSPLQKQVITANVAISGTDEPRAEILENPTHPEVREVGRIIIEKIPTEQEQILVYGKNCGKPASADLANRIESISDVSSIMQKNCLMKGASLDAKQVEKTPKESRYVQEKLLTNIDEIYHQRQATDKKKSAAGSTVDHLHVRDVEFDRSPKKTSLKDRIIIPHQNGTTQKIIVSRDIITRSEGKDQPRYSQEKEVKNGCDLEALQKLLIVDNDNYYKEQDITTHFDDSNLLRKQVTTQNVIITSANGPISTDVASRRENISDVLRSAQKRDMAPVGKLDVEQFERSPEELRRSQEKLLGETDEKSHQQKAVDKKESAVLERRVDQLYLQEVYGFDRFSKKIPFEDKSNIPRQNVTGKKIMAPKKSITNFEEAEKPRYPKEMNSGRIVTVKEPENKVIISKNNISYPELTKHIRSEITEAKHEVIDSRNLPRETWAMYTEELDGRLKPGRDDKSKKQQKPLIVDDEDYYGKKDQHIKSHSDDTTPLQKVITENVKKVTRAYEPQAEKLEEQTYPTAHEVGRIVIKEIPGEQEKIPLYANNSRKQTNTDVSRIVLKDNMAHVGRLDHVQQLEINPKESKSTQKAYEIFHEGKALDKKVSAVLEGSVDQLYVQDVDFDRFSKKIPFEDKSNIPRQNVTGEKIMVPKDSIASFEKTKKPRYPKEMNPGRIVIANEPENKVFISKNNISYPELAKPIQSEITEAKHELLDTQNLPRETRTMYTEEVDGRLKPGRDDTSKEQQKPLIVDDEDYYGKKDQHIKLHSDDTTPLQKLITENVKVTRAYEPRAEKLEEQTYPTVHEVGRIVIKEIPEEQEKIPLYTKYSRKQTNTDVSRTFQKDNMPQVGRLDHVKQLVKNPKEAKNTQEANEIFHEGKSRGDDKSVEQQEPFVFDDNNYYRLKDQHLKSHLGDGTPLEKQVTIENVPVTRAYEICAEKLNEFKYPTINEVGRVLIQEMPEEQEKSPLYKEYYVESTSTDVTNRRGTVSDHVGTVQENDIMKVGRLDLQQLEKTPKECRRAQEQEQRRDEESEEQQKPIMVNDDYYYKEKYQIVKSQSDDTNLLQKEVVTRNSIVTRAHEPRDAKLEELTYPTVHEVGRIAVREIPEKQDVSTRQKEISDVLKNVRKDNMTQLARHDVQQSRKNPNESRTEKEKRLTKTDEIYHQQEITDREETAPKARVGPLHVDDVQCDSENKSLENEINIPGQKITTQDTVASRDDITCSDIPTYPEKSNIRRIVLEEVPEINDHIPIQHIYNKEPASNEVTLERQKVKEISRTQHKKEALKVGRLDNVELGEILLDTKRVELQEGITVYADRADGTSKIKHSSAPGVQDIIRVEDSNYNQERRWCRPQTSILDTSFQNFTTEPVSISRQDITHRENVEKAKYTKDVDIGRLVIEEVPENEEILEQVSQVDKRKSKPDIQPVIQFEAKDLPKIKTEDIKIGKFDVTDFEKSSVETRTIDNEMTTYKNICKDIHKNENIVSPGNVNEGFYIEDKPGKVKPRLDDTRPICQVASEKKTVIRSDGFEQENLEKMNQASEMKINQRFFGKSNEDKSRFFSNQRVKQPGATEMTNFRQDVRDVCRPYEKTVEKVDEEQNMGEPKVQDLHKPREFEKRPLKDTEKTEHRCKAEKDYGGKQLEERSYKDYQREKIVPRRDEQLSKLTEKVTVSRHDICGTEEKEKTNQPTKEDIGPLVIKEISGEKVLPQKEVYMGKPLNTDVAITKCVADIPSMAVMDKAIKVGNIDTDIFGEQSNDFQEDKKFRMYRENMKSELKRDKVVKRENEMTGRDFIEGTYKDTSEQMRPRLDETRFSRGIASEKITVTRNDGFQPENPEEVNHPSKIEVDQNKLRFVSSQHSIQPDATEVTKIGEDVEHVSTTYRQKHVMDHGELAIQEVSPQHIQALKEIDERQLKCSEKVDYHRKLKRKEKSGSEERLDPRHVGADHFFTKMRKEKNPRADNTWTSQKEVAIEKVPVSQVDGIINEDIKKSENPREQEIVRIEIKEIPEQTKESKRQDQPKIKRDAPKTDHCRIEDKQLRNIQQNRPDLFSYETKPSQKQIRTGTLFVDRRDTAVPEKASKYPKEINVRRISVEEGPEQIELIPRHGTKCSDVSGPKYVTEDVRKADEKKDLFNVDKLDQPDLEKEVQESTEANEIHAARSEMIGYDRRTIEDQYVTHKSSIPGEKVAIERQPGKEIWRSPRNEKKSAMRGKDQANKHRKIGQIYGSKDLSTMDTDGVSKHKTINDTVWEKRKKTLQDYQEELVASDNIVHAETILVTGTENEEPEGVTISVHKVEGVGNQEENKVRRFKIDESCDRRGAQKKIKGKHVKHWAKKSKLKEVRERQRADEKVEYYQKKDMETSRRDYDRKHYEENYREKLSDSQRRKHPDFSIYATQFINSPAKYTKEYYCDQKRQTTLPWIEVRKQITEKEQREKKLALQKRRNGNQLTQKSVEKDRLLLLKIPQNSFLSMQKSDCNKTKEIAIPWMEIEASPDVSNDCLPWIQLEAHDPKTGRDRLIMLKIPREMVLKTSKFSKNTEKEIQLSLDDVTRYWEETGQIPVGSTAHTRNGSSLSMSIALPKQTTNGCTLTRSIRSEDNLPTIRLMMPKKLYAVNTWRGRPLINFDPNRQIKLRVNNQSTSTAEEITRTIRLDKYDKESKYIPVSLTRDYPRRVLLVDGNAWKPLEVDNLESLDKENVQECRSSCFCNAYEIGRENEGKSFPDLREFTKEHKKESSDDHKLFNFIINSNKKEKKTK